MKARYEVRNIAVVGAGAMGSLFGGLLSEGGLDVTLIDVWKDHIGQIRRNGLRMTGEGGDRIIPIKAATDPREVGAVDLVIVQTKARHAKSAIEGAGPLLHSETAVISFQNGLGKEEILSAAVGSDRVLGGTTAQGANILEPGVVRNSGNLPTRIGELNGALTDRIMAIGDAFNRAGLKTIVSNDIKLDIWKKLMANVAINPISALCNFRVGELFDVPEVKEVILDALDEAAKVANAEGIKLDVAESKQVLLEITGKGGTGSGRSGMLIDVLARHKTEIDFINGAIVRLGKKHGIPTPINRTLVAAVKGLERNFE